MSENKPIRYCPNCSCTGCQVANFKEQFERLRQIALKYGNFHHSEEVSIGSAIRNLHHFPETIGREAIDLLDSFSILIRKIRP